MIWTTLPVWPTPVPLFACVDIPLLSAPLYSKAVRRRKTLYLKLNSLSQPCARRQKGSARRTRKGGLFVRWSVVLAGPAHACEAYEAEGCEDEADDCKEGSAVLYADERDVSVLKNRERAEHDQNEPEKPNEQHHNARKIHRAPPCLKLFIRRRRNESSCRARFGGLRPSVRDVRTRPCRRLRRRFRSSAGHSQ